MEQKEPYWIRCLLAERDTMQLRSIDSKSLLVQTTLLPAHHQPTTVRGLIDSGCSGRGFIDEALVHRLNLPTYATPYPRTLLLADGKTASTITKYVVIPAAIGIHDENCLFFVTRLSNDTQVIFGLPWLKRHNPSINWFDMSLTFDSWYCMSHCSYGRVVCAPTIADPPIAFHDLPIPTIMVTPPDNAALKPPLYATPTIRGSNYNKATCEEADEENESQQGDEPLRIKQTLTPGHPHHRTHSAAVGAGAVPECRAVMIRNRPDTKPAPLQIVGGRRVKSQPPKRNLSHHSAPRFRTRKTYIDPLIRMRYAWRLRQVQFCKTPGVQAIKVTWDELDAMDNPPTPTVELPRLPDDVYKDVLNGNADPEWLRRTFPKEFHDFLDEYGRALWLRGVSEADVEKFMADKPDLTRKTLPSYSRTGSLTCTRHFHPGWQNIYRSAAPGTTRLKSCQEKSRHTRRIDPSQRPNSALYGNGSTTT